MGRRILAISIAVVLALVGAGLVLIYASRADERAIADASPQPVYVVAEPVASGTTLKEAIAQKQLIPTQVAAKALPIGALQTVDESNSNLLAITDLPVGTYALADSFGLKPVGEKAIDVPAGQLAVSVQLEDPARVGSFVRPGSHLAIFATYTPVTKDSSATSGETPDAAEGSQVRATTVLLDDVLVIAMGNTSLTPASPPTGEQQGQSKQQAASFLVTVAVSPHNAARLIHGISDSNYTLYAALRGDDLSITPKNLTIDDLDLLEVPTK